MYAVAVAAQSCVLVLVFIGLLYDTYVQLLIMRLSLIYFNFATLFLAPPQTLSMSTATTLQVIGPTFTAPKITGPGIR
jgi:hypothetical protein